MNKYCQIHVASFVWKQMRQQRNKWEEIPF